MTLGMAGNSLANSLEGVWKIKSGRWASEGADVVYPSDPAHAKGSAICTHRDRPSGIAKRLLVLMRSGAVTQV